MCCLLSFDYDDSTILENPLEIGFFRSGNPDLDIFLHLTVLKFFIHHVSEKCLLLNLLKMKSEPIFIIFGVHYPGNSGF